MGSRRGWGLGKELWGLRVGLEGLGRGWHLGGEFGGLGGDWGSGRVSSLSKHPQHVCNNPKYFFFYT